MTPAEQARENAIPLELKKDGLQQRQSGDWVLRVIIAAADMDQRIIAAPMGTRFQAALVEIDDDETPKPNEAKRKWRELGALQQSVLRCSDPIFWAFLKEHLHYQVDNGEQAAAVIRDHCEISSRSDLGKPGFVQNRLLWHELDNAFAAWKASEYA
jgi:hypothetical protein